MGGLLPAWRIPASSPSVASWGENRLDVFVKGGDNALYHIWWDGSVWSAYERLGENLEGAPAAISRAPNLIDVFFRGRDNHLYQKEYDGSTWLPAVDLGSGQHSDVAVSSWGLRRLDLFCEDDNNTLQHLSWDGKGWTRWESIGHGIDDTPSAVSWMRTGSMCSRSARTVSCYTNISRDHTSRDQGLFDLRLNPE